MKSLWQIGAGRVTRAGLTVATYSEKKDGWGWRGFGHERVGFNEPTKAEREASILSDVKYFYQYQRNKPLVTFTYASGRKVEVWPR